MESCQKSHVGRTKRKIRPLKLGPVKWLPYVSKKRMAIFFTESTLELVSGWSLYP